MRESKSIYVFYILKTAHGISGKTDSNNKLWHIILVKLDFKDKSPEIPGMIKLVLLRKQVDIQLLKNNP